jgi:hypothetical protein
MIRSLRIFLVMLFSQYVQQRLPSTLAIANSQLDLLRDIKVFLVYNANQLSHALCRSGAAIYG